MERTSESDHTPRAEYNRNARRLAQGWTLFLIAAVLLGGAPLCLHLHRNLNAARRVHHARIDPSALEPPITQAEAARPQGALEVRTGVYIDRIPELNVKEATWTVDAVVWFNWKGKADLQPGDNIEVVDGWIEERQKVLTRSEGDQHYERYRIVAHITKYFDVHRFPLDDHELTLNLELPAFQRSEVLLVPDDESCVSSTLQVFGYRVGATHALEKPHAYESELGDPLIRGHAVHSMFRMAIPLEREGWSFFLKVIQSLFASIAVALVPFCMRPTALEARLSLGVGAFFAAIASTYITASLIPDTGVMTMADSLDGVGMVLIFLTTLQSVLSNYLHELRGGEHFAHKFDRRLFWVFLICSVGLCLAIPLSAVL